MDMIHAIAAAVLPAYHRPDRRPLEAASKAAIARDADELERAAREENRRSSCALLATAERILLGHKRLNGHTHD